jgi:hypothetical protein
MGDNKGGTIYQKINGFLNMENIGGNQNFTTGTNSSPNSQNRKIIIKGNTPEEIYRKGLELEQKQKLQDKFFRTTDRGFQKAMQYEAARLPAYIDFEGMEFYPIIASALDLFMEEATTIGANGKMLSVYSNKDRIKSTLEDFFYNIVNVNVNLPFWTRNLPVKYDSVVPLLNGELITIKEISERLKNNPREDIFTYAIQDNTKNIVVGKIIWCDLTRKNAEIYRIHLDDGTFVETTPDHEFMMRNGSYKRADQLLNDDSLMPFYTLISKENANIKGYEKVYDPSSNRHKYTHRIVANEFNDKIAEKGSGEKYVTHHKNFNKLDNSPINLIRMTTGDHSEYHAKLANEILKRPDVVINRMKSIDKYLRSDERCNRMSKEMSGIYPQYFNDYNNSDLHDKHNNIRIDGMKELWSDSKKRNNIIDRMQLKLDDNCINYIKEILGGKYISSINLSNILKNDEFFMSMFKNINKHFRKNLYKSLNSTTIVNIIKRTLNLTYFEFLYENNNAIILDPKYIHGKKISEGLKANRNVLSNHKVLFIEKLNNTYDAYCMEVVGPNNEQDRHNFAVCGKNENGEYQRNGTFVSNCKYGDNFVGIYGEKGKGITTVRQMVNYEIERFERVQDGKMSIKFKERMTGDEFNTFEMAHFRLLGDDKMIPYGSSMLNKVRRVFRQLVLAEDAMLTYRLIRAGEKKVFKIDVGNIDEDDVEEYMYKVSDKFKRTPQIDQNNGQIDYRFNIMGVDEDYFIPVRNANVQTGVDTLAGATNLNDINDISYLRDNLFIGLGIPKPFLSFQDASGGGKNIAQFDIRFAKKVNRIQQAIIQELNKMAMIHLLYIGFDTDDINNFALSLTNPSTQEELLKIELMQSKAQVYTEMTRSEGGIAAMSHTNAKRQIFVWSDSQIVEDLRQQKMEKVIMQEFADSPVVIKKTGLFADIDKKYGVDAQNVSVSGNTQNQPTSMDGGGGGSMGGGMPPMDAGMPPMDNTNISAPPEGGELPTDEKGVGEKPAPIPGLPNQSPADLPPIKENNKYNDNVNELVYGNKENKIKKETKALIMENKSNILEINNKTNNMINEANFLIGNEINEENNDLIDIDLINLNLE